MAPGVPQSEQVARPTTIALRLIASVKVSRYPHDVARGETARDPLFLAGLELGAHPDPWSFNRPKQFSILKGLLPFEELLWRSPRTPGMLRWHH